MRWTKTSRSWQGWAELGRSKQEQAAVGKKMAEEDRSKQELSVSTQAELSRVSTKWASLGYPGCCPCLTHRCGGFADNTSPSSPGGVLTPSSSPVNRFDSREWEAQGWNAVSPKEP